MPTQTETAASLAMFTDNHRLPESFRVSAQQWFLPLVERLAAKAATSPSPLVVGINGSQGSGKSTLSSLLASLLTEQGLNSVTLSLDDFYHTRAERHHLGDAVHPLLETRGVPGTHDIHLAEAVINALSQDEGEVKLPRFNKAIDDRRPEEEWPVATLPVKVIIFEGWCLGTPPQLDTELQSPVNSFEEDEDHDHAWRRFVNEQLREFYPALSNRIHYWVLLKAPNFDCVYRWRQEQEDRLAASETADAKIMTAPQLHRFIQHYERLTRHTLRTMPDRVDEVFCMDENRQIIEHQYHPR